MPRYLSLSMSYCYLSMSYVIYVLLSISLSQSVIRFFILSLRRGRKSSVSLSDFFFHSLSQILNGVFHSFLDLFKLSQKLYSDYEERLSPLSLRLSFFHSLRLWRTSFISSDYNFFFSLRLSFFTLSQIMKNIFHLLRLSFFHSLSQIMRNVLSSLFLRIPFFLSFRL